MGLPGHNFRIVHRHTGFAYDLERNVSPARPNGCENTDRGLMQAATDRAIRDQVSDLIAKYTDARDN